MSTLSKKKCNTYASSVLDIYLFINPIDTFCHCGVNRLITAMSCLSYKCYFHIIPYQNQEMLDNYIASHNLPNNDLVLRQTIQANALNVTRTFKAATFQGKKKARLFLYHLNQYTKTYGHNLTNDMLIESAAAANLDIEMLLADRESEMVNFLMTKDIKMAQKFNVNTIPSAIVFDSLLNDGILIENTISSETILFALETQPRYKTK